MGNPTDNASHDRDGWEAPIFNDAVLIDHKAIYVKKDKKYAKQQEDVCIICRIIKMDEHTPAYEVYRNNLSIVFLNLYPYQVGHIMISPLRHIMGYEEYTEEEMIDIGKITQKTLNVLKAFGNTESFNVGWNQGLVSGGSIKHHHIHIVPRYRNELNFMEIIARTKPFIQSLDETLEGLRRYAAYYKDEKTLDEIVSKYQK